MGRVVRHVEQEDQPRLEWDKKIEDKFDCLIDELSLKSQDVFIERRLNKWAKNVSVFWDPQG